MKNIKFFAIIAGALFFIHPDIFAQCKSVAKKQCLPQLLPYTQNGQFNSTRLAPGESAEVQMIFYAGQNYRLLVCAEGVLGDVHYRVTNADNQELFNSSKSDHKNWDFNVSSTQTLNVIVEAPPSRSSNKIIPEGCVSILIGFMKL